MNKTKLQEICQRKRWSLPKYSVEKYGFDHVPHFQASVTVNGLTFSSGDQCKSSKDAQDEAALRAFNHFSAPEFTPSEAPPIPSGPSRLRVTVSMTSDLNMEFPTPGASQLKLQEMSQIPHMIGNATLVKDNGRCKDTDREAEANMYKAKLNEFCQRQRWRPPDYVVKKKGPDHLPQFQATVKVNGLSFGTNNLFNSSKDAQNNAAKIAFCHFCPSNLPSSLSQIQSFPSLVNDFTDAVKMRTTEGSSCAIADLNKDIPLCEISQLKPQKTNQDPQHIGTARHVKDDDRYRDMQHSYKSQLQYYAQKSNISLPAYSCKQEGPPHASRFKGVVRVGERTYDSQELFPTRKEAEHMAAKVALMSLSQNGIQEDESIYKNLLQELAQKECYGLPSYNTLRSGEPHTPIFLSTVKVEEYTFKGHEAKTKKQAEMSAARIAYRTLKERIASQTAISHQGKGNPEFLSFGLQSEQTVDPVPNFHAEPPPNPDEEEEEIEVPICIDPYSIRLEESCGSSAVNDELSSSSSVSYDSDQDTQAPTETTISSYPDSSSCTRPDSSSSTRSDSSSSTRVTVFPRRHPRPLPPGGTMKDLNDEFVAYTWKPKLYG